VYVEANKNLMLSGGYVIEIIIFTKLKIVIYGNLRFASVD